MDLVIVVILLLLVAFIYKKFSSFIYFFGILDIFFRLRALIKYQLDIPEVTQFFNKYVPESLLGIFQKYSTGVFQDILTWGYIIAMGAFLYYVFRTFLKKK